MKVLSTNQLAELEENITANRDVEAKSALNGETRLHRAVTDADLALVQLLIKLGADVHARENHDGRQPLHLAAVVSRDENTVHESIARMDIMRALLSSGADIETKDYGGDTPLLLASASRLSFPVRFLISSGANTKATGTQGNRTSEHVIGLLRDSDGALAVAALLDAGIDPNAKDGQGETLLGCAAWLGSTSAVISLLEAGSNPKAPGWYQRQPLHYAAELMHNPDGDEAFAALLEAGADVDATDKAGVTCLHRAVLCGSARSVELLLKKGAKVDVRNVGGRTPFHFVPLAGHPDGVSAGAALWKAGGGDINARDNTGRTSLFCAIEKGFPLAAQWLLDIGADPNLATIEGLAPLHQIHTLVVCPGGPEVVAALFKAGADVRAKDKYRQTPLSSATLAGSPQAIQLLLKAGADPNERDAKLHGPLHFTSHVIDRPGGPDAIMALIHAGADVNAADDSGKTPLYMAAENGAAGVVLLLHKAGARADVRGPDDHVPLHFSGELCRHPDGPAAVAALLEAGVDPRAVDKNGTTTVLLAAMKQSLPAVRLLLKAGADPNIRDKYGQNSLHRTAGLLHHPDGAEVLSTLIDGGADVHAVDDFGRSPLFHAARDGSAAAVQLLLRAGADPHLRDKQSQTPLHLAVESPEGADAVVALLKSGADVNALDGVGDTPLILAAKQRCAPTILELLKAGGNPSARGKGGHVPLDFAPGLVDLKGGGDAVAALLQATAREIAAARDGASPLHEAVRLGFPTVILALLESKIDPNVRDGSGNTALHDAIEVAPTPEAVAVISALIAGGADMHIGNKHGDLPLQRALDLRSIAVVNTLLDVGAHTSVYRNRMEELSNLMHQLREEMLALLPQRRDEYMRMLSKLYAAYEIYPSEPTLQECEVRRLKDDPTGTGGFANCWEGLFLNEHKVAMKCPHAYIQESVAARRIAREVGVWRNLRHPHVLAFVGLCTLGSSTYMISPWMDNGGALGYVEKNPQVDCLCLLVQIAEGLQYLHNFDPVVVHGDLKGANILISSSGDAHIADFGLSQAIIEGSIDDNSTTWHAAGSRRWQAPELVRAETKEQAQRTTASDIFAMGRVTVELLTRQVPFSEINDQAVLMTKVTNGELPSRPKDKETISRGFDKRMSRLITECCHMVPARRPNADEVVLRLKKAADNHNGAKTQRKVRMCGISFPM